MAFVHPTLSCTRLNFNHPGRVDLLENFSVKLPSGQVIALIGQSGCGKSTLLRFKFNCTYNYT
ncbi:MAG TPA: ATP-binding cassette domain-containing protein [Chroococcales cyanobacterium]